MKTTFNSILFVLLFVPGFLLAQTTVSGIVTEQSTSLPLPGVNVLVKGTTNGTATDFDGNYLIDINNGEILKYSMESVLCLSLNSFF